MRIIRCVSPDATVELLSDYLLPDTDYDKDVLLQMMHYHMSNTPQDILVLVAIDAEELLGFILTIAEPSVSHAFVMQAWVSTKAPPGTSKKLLSRVVMWAEDLGRTSIRMETYRDARLFTRRFGFKEFSSIMQLPIGLTEEISEDTSIDVRSEPPKDIYNGQKLQDEKLSEGSESDPTSNGEFLKAENRNGSDGVFGITGRGPDPRDAEPGTDADGSGPDSGPVRPARSSPAIVGRETVSVPRRE